VIAPALRADETLACWPLERDRLIPDTPDFSRFRLLAPAAVRGDKRERRD
jgi:hypothetical protein